jgi:non-catalytic primase subunit PriX-like protein
MTSPKIEHPPSQLPSLPSPPSPYKQQRKNTQSISSVFEEGFDFILTHLQEPLWPRTIFTETLGRQYTSYSKEEAFARFKQANFLDCRINAYPYYTGFDGINRQPPNFIFIDIDRCLFKADKEFWREVEKTCNNIEQILGGNPTVLWTGKGIHIYQPVEAMILEQESLFANFDQPSQTFLKYAAHLLSNQKSDTNNNPAFRSCLLRIPGSHNSKCVRQNSIADSNSEIKIIQRWDGARPKINSLLYKFFIYLADRKIKEIKSTQSLQREHPDTPKNFILADTIPWIEKLLRTPIDDYRKNAVSLIIAPYLINIRKLSYDEALGIVNNWLSKCGELRPLDHRFNYLAKYALKNALKNRYRPLGFDSLRLKNKVLYERLRQQN